MRIYIIGNDGITLCREVPASVTDGEVAVASQEELHAVPLSGKRLLALWNALPDVEKRKKVGDREALIDQLWSAIEAFPDPEPQPDAKRPSKQDEVIAMLRRDSPPTRSAIFLPDREFPGKVTRIADALQPGTRTLLTEVATYPIPTSL